MKAAVYRGPGQVQCETVPDPVLTPDSVLLKVTACGICGSDLRTYRHGMRGNLDFQILGHEISGVVAAMGEQVSGYAVGDRLAVAADVHCHQCYYCKKALYNLCENWRLIGTHLPGGMADYLLLTPDILTHGILHRIPDSLADLPSALAEPASSVIWAQQLLQIEPGEVVVVFGDGPIGALQVQVAQARGAKAVVIGLTGGRLEMFRERDLGAWKVFNNDTDDVVAEVRALTEGRGADAAIVAARRALPRPRR
ncbi:MAG: alcohol dehydrogenase catalytic domain-containing protein [Anaerolineae bacterium]|nr:alcohol dehydrogenase catalytic domain-containing protein [Anaerolineae bacterium]